MKSHLASVFFFAATAFGASNCTSNNCARAVKGTRLGDSHPRIASVDCSSFFQTTVTPIVTVHVTNFVATTTATIQAKRQISTSGIPFYARVCTKPGSYQSACSCLGVLPSTVTAAASTVTIISNSTSTLNYTLSSSKTSSSASPSCTNTASDPQNCGTCGHVCESGVCVNGDCATSGCVASTCQSFNHCSESDSCFCVTSAQATFNLGFCTANAFCSELNPCTTNGDCGTGNICAVETCCAQGGDGQPGVCLPSTCSNPASKLKLMSRGRGHTVAY